MPVSRMVLKLGGWCSVQVLKKEQRLERSNRIAPSKQTSETSRENLNVSHMNFDVLPTTTMTAYLSNRRRIVRSIPVHSSHLRLSIPSRFLVSQPLRPCSFAPRDPCLFQITSHREPSAVSKKMPACSAPAPLASF